MDGRNVLQAPCNHLWNEIHMFHPHWTLICHFVLWNVTHWKLHILILMFKFGFLFIIMSHFIIKKVYRYKSWCYCLFDTIHTWVIFSTIISVAKLIIILLNIFKSAGMCCSSVLLLLWSLNKYVDVLEAVWELLVADMLTDE